MSIILRSHYHGALQHYRKIDKVEEGTTVRELFNKCGVFAKITEKSPDKFSVPVGAEYSLEGDKIICVTTGEEEVDPEELAVDTYEYILYYSNTIRRGSRVPEIHKALIILLLFARKLHFEREESDIITTTTIAKIECAIRSLDEVLSLYKEELQYRKNYTACSKNALDDLLERVIVFCKPSYLG